MNASILALTPTGELEQLVFEIRIDGEGTVRAIPWEYPGRKNLALIPSAIGKLDNDQFQIVTREGKLIFALPKVRDLRATSENSFQVLVETPNGLEFREYILQEDENGIIFHKFSAGEPINNAISIQGIMLAPSKIHATSLLTRDGEVILASVSQDPNQLGVLIMLESVNTVLGLISPPKIRKIVSQLRVIGTQAYAVINLLLDESNGLWLYDSLSNSLTSLSLQPEKVVYAANSTLVLAENQLYAPDYVRYEAQLVATGVQNVVDVWGTISGSFIYFANNGEYYLYESIGGRISHLPNLNQWELLEHGQLRTQGKGTKSARY